MKSSKRFLMIGLALALAAFTAACSFSVSTAKIEEAIMTNIVDAEGKPGDAVTSFSADVRNSLLPQKSATHRTTPRLQSFGHI